MMLAQWLSDNYNIGNHIMRQDRPRAPFGARRGGDQ
jgi:hypothetical protein